MQSGGSRGRSRTRHVLGGLRLRRNANCYYASRVSREYLSVIYRDISEFRIRLETFRPSVITIATIASLVRKYPRRNLRPLGLKGINNRTVRYDRFDPTASTKWKAEEYNLTGDLEIPNPECRGLFGVNVEAEQLRCLATSRTIPSLLCLYRVLAR
jgi:hypothetical protein